MVLREQTMAINFQSFGDGDPLIVIHGLFGTSDNLRAVAKQLSDQHKVFLIDAPGHGDSDTLSLLSLGNMADAVYEFIQQQDLSKVSILGHSLGGKIAMELALKYPDSVDKLLVADIAPVQYKPRHDDIISSLKAVPLTQIKSRKEADAILAEKIKEAGVRGFLLKSLARDESGWRWRFDLDRLANDYEELIKSNSNLTFDGSVLMIVGGESNYVLPEYRNEIVSRFPGVEAKVIAGAGHWLHAERQTAFVKICRDFLSR